MPYTPKLTVTLPTGDEYMLTPDQIHEAYLEQEFMYDYNDVESYLLTPLEDNKTLTSMSSALHITEDEYISKVAGEYRRILDKCDFSYGFEKGDIITEACQNVNSGLI